MPSTRSLILSFAGLATLAACGSRAPESGEFAAACNAAGNLDPELCACLDEQAEALAPDTHRFVIATIAGEEAEAQQLRGDLDDQRARQADQFVQRGIQACIITLPASEDTDVIERPPQPGEAAPPEGDDAMAGETAMSESGPADTAPTQD